MSNAITCRAMDPGEAEDVAALALTSFNEFISPEYTPQGVAEFRR